MNLSQIEKISKASDMLCLQIIIIDMNLDLMWHTDSELFNEENLILIKKQLKITKNKQDFIDLNKHVSTITLNNKNYTCVYYPVVEEGNQFGYTIRFVEIEDLRRNYLHKDYADLQVELFSKIRAEISGVLSSSTLLQNSLEENDMYNEMKFINSTVNNCYRILAAITNPTEITKYAYNMHKVTTVNLKDFLGDISTYMISLLRKENVKITFKCDEDIFVDVDADRLIVAFMNLISHAIGNNISEEKIVDIAVKKIKNHAFITISDNGSGMSEENIKNCFEIYGYKNNDKDIKDNGDSFLDADIIRLFCKTFGAQLYVSTKQYEGSCVALKMKISEEKDFPLYMSSKISDYFTNRFSPLYVMISRITDIKYL